MLGQSSFFAIGPVEVTGNTVSVNTGNLGSPSQKYTNLYLTGTGNADTFSSRQVEAATGQITGLSVNNLYPIGQPNLGHPTQRWNNLYATGTGYLDRVETKSQFTNSGVFDYLGPTGRFFPPLLTFEMRTGLFSGLATPEITPYDGLLVFQTTSGQKLMTVQSGMWKTVTLS